MSIEIYGEIGSGRLPFAEQFNEAMGCPEFEYDSETGRIFFGTLLFFLTFAVFFFFETRESMNVRLKKNLVKKFQFFNCSFNFYK